MPVYFYKSRIIIAILLSIALLASSCKSQQDAYVTNVLEQYFEANILNRDFKVLYATDNGTEITTQFDGWVFKLLKNTYYDGPMTAKKTTPTGTIQYSGTWSSNSDFGKLVITLNQPSVPAEFVFLNRDWRFEQKAIPVMKLAPWGSAPPKQLHMQRL
jgi:hypothetical protein